MANGRILHAKLPPEANPDHHVQDSSVEPAASKDRQQRSNEAESMGMAAAKAAQVHVRVGFEGMQDADRGQQPTVWAVTRREDSSGEQTCRFQGVQLNRSEDLANV